MEPITLLAGGLAFAVCGWGEARRIREAPSQATALDWMVYSAMWLSAGVALSGAIRG